MARLTYKKRKALKSSSFVFPKERRYPIHDINHARSALAMVARFGDSAEKKRVRTVVFTEDTRTQNKGSETKCRIEEVDRKEG